jgi:hypothetical protein
MSLRANRYPDIWEFSNDSPSPKSIPTWVDDKVRVRKFVDIFLSTQFFKKLIFWRYPEYAGASYFIDRHADFRVIDYLYEAEEVRYEIENLSLTGHLCVLFVPLNSDVFLDKILEGGHYGKPDQILVGDKSKEDPLAWRYGQNIEFLESNVFKDCNRLFAFFHDAQFLYEIFR